MVRKEQPPMGPVNTHVTLASLKNGVTKRMPEDSASGVGWDEGMGWSLFLLSQLP